MTSTIRTLRIRRLPLTLVAIAAGLLTAGCSKKTVKKETLISSERDPNGSLVQRFDLTGNGKPNLWKHFKEEKEEGETTARKILVRRELDLDNDGRPDIKHFFDGNDVLVRAEFDLDYDGKFEATEFYKDGKPVKRAWDRNGDGRVEIIKYFQDGKLVLKERDENNDGKVDVWEYYEDEKLVRVGRDKDGDGKPELFNDRPDDATATGAGS